MITRLLLMSVTDCGRPSLMAHLKVTWLLCFDVGMPNHHDDLKLPNYSSLLTSGASFRMAQHHFKDLKEGTPSRYLSNLQLPRQMLIRRHFTLVDCFISQNYLNPGIRILLCFSTLPQEKLVSCLESNVKYTLATSVILFN